MQQNVSVWDACISGNLEELESLVREGADINVQNDKGMTPLMYVANGGYGEMVKLLLDFGADKEVENFDGHKALDLAILPEITTLLK